VENEPSRRVIVGTWQTRADWEVWHRDPHFAETRRQLDPLVDGPGQRWWHEMVVDTRVGLVFGNDDIDAACNAGAMAIARSSGVVCA